MKAAAVFITAANAREARRIARALVEEKLAACVSRLGPARSLYRWQGRVESAHEILLIAKTSAKKFPALARRVNALHSYRVPEVIALPISRGLPAYMGWLRESLR